VPFVVMKSDRRLDAPPLVAQGLWPAPVDGKLVSVAASTGQWSVFLVLKQIFPCARLPLNSSETRHLTKMASGSGNNETRLIGL
jgi:hypothetical protein